MVASPASESFSGTDAAWLRMEKPDNLMTITAVLCFDGKVDYGRLRAKIADELVEPFIRFRQRVIHRDGILLRPRWELDPTFDLDRHIRVVRLSEPTDKAFRAFLDGLASIPLESDRPLWEALLVENTPQGNALVARIHHSLADGFSLVYLTLSLVDEGCEIELPSGLRVERPNLRESKAGQNRAHAAPKVPRKMPGALAALKSVARAGECLLHLLTLPRDSQTRLKGPLSGEKRVAWSKAVPLSTIKAIGTALGGTVNDILLLAMAGAIRRYLSGRGDSLDGLEVRCTVPVNLRPLERRDASLGNGFGLVFLELPVGIDDVHRRLAELRRRMDALKGSVEPVVSFATLAVAGMTPSVVQDALTGVFSGKSTFVVTNVPGPTKRLQFAGKPIANLRFFVPQSAGAGIGVSFFSYAGSVEAGILADAVLLPDPMDLARAMDEEIAALARGVP